MKIGLNAKTTPRNNSRQGLFSRLRNGLAKTQTTLFSGINELFSRDRPVDENTILELEEHLLMADVGVDATGRIISELEKAIRKSGADSATSTRQVLAGIMLDILQTGQPEVSPETALNETGVKPLVILMVGVNGTGKTTTAGKLARRMLSQGKSVMFAAADTFRAAAIEQLHLWGDRNNITVISQHQGADSSAVIFDALQAARARNVDVLIADTAGRLHNQYNLMEELKKINRTITRFDNEIPVQKLLVVDAGAGQNVLNQVKQFNDAIGLNGIVLTKLDGTARGGIVFALSMSGGIPVKYIGLGEQIDDLQPFLPVDFVNALLEPEK